MAGRATARGASGVPSPGLMGSGGGLNPLPSAAVNTSVPKGTRPVWAA